MDLGGGKSWYWFGLVQHDIWETGIPSYKRQFLYSAIGLVWYSVGVGRTGCYTIITICCAGFVFVQILIWFCKALEWGEPVDKSSLQYAGWVLSWLWYWFGLVQRWSGENRLLHHHYNIMRGFFLCSDIGLVWYSAGVGRTGSYTIITICCADFFFALILVWFGTALEWGEQVATPSLQYAARIFSLLWYWFGLVQRWSGENRFYTIITICCTCFVFALTLVWFGTALEWGEPVATPSLQYAARIFSLLWYWFGLVQRWSGENRLLHHHYNMLHVFCLRSDIGLVWYSAGVGRTGCYTFITICCTCFVFALILVWFGTALEWGEPAATSPSTPCSSRSWPGGTWTFSHTFSISGTPPIDIVICTE